MNLNTMNDVDKKILTAMLDTRFHARSLEGVSNQCEFGLEGKILVKDFLQKHPQVFICYGRDEHSMWRVDPRCQGPNLDALRIVLFGECGIFPIEAAVNVELPVPEAELEEEEDDGVPGLHD